MLVNKSARASVAGRAVRSSVTPRGSRLRTHAAQAHVSTGRQGSRYIVSEELKRKFEEDGFVHLPGVMSEEEMQQVIDPVYFRYTRGEIPVPGKDLCDMSGVQGRTPDEFTVYNVMLPRIYYKPWQNNLFEQRCRDIADQLHGGDMDVDYDQILAKRPETSDSIFAWHQDMAYWPPLDSPLLTATCWLAVSESTRENGCMRFVRGSHREPELRRHFPLGKSREDSHALYTTVEEDQEPVVYVPIRRGDITVHNERVVHGSGANRSGVWRHAYVMAFRKKECIAEERAKGFTHSHNDTNSWDVFNKWSPSS